MSEPDPTIEALWRDMLTNPEAALYKKGRIFRHVPGDPRCRLCRIPLGGIAGPILKLTGRRPARYTPTSAMRARSGRVPIPEGQ
jgi:adenylate cyclase